MSNTPSSHPSTSVWPGPAHFRQNTQDQAQTQTDNSAQERNENVSSLGSNSGSTWDSTSEQLTLRTGEFPSKARTASSQTAPGPTPRRNDFSSESNEISESHQRALSIRDWFEFPPTQASEFMPDVPTTFTSRENLLARIDHYLKDSASLRTYLDSKRLERVQLWETSNLKKLAEARQFYGTLAVEGGIARLRLDAKANKLRLPRQVSEERTRIVNADKPLLLDIGKAWCSFVGVPNYEEQAIIRQNQAEPQPISEILRMPSKAECLLGSDGSTPNVTQYLNRVQSFAFSGTPRLFRMSFDEGVPGEVETSNEHSTELGANRSVEVLIPEWFHDGDLQHLLQLPGATDEARYKALLGRLADLEKAKQTDKYHKQHPEEEGVVRNLQWDQHYHEPNSGWQHPYHQRRGGWWKCRKGPTVPFIELSCKLCHNARESTSQSNQNNVEGPAEIYDQMMAVIRKAMNEVAQADKAIVLARMGQGSYTSPEDGGGLWMKDLRRQVDDVDKQNTHNAAAENVAKRGAPCTLNTYRGLAGPFASEASGHNYHPLRGYADPTARYCKVGEPSPSQGDIGSTYPLW